MDAIMTKQTTARVGGITMHLDHEAVQNLRCWVLLNHILRKEIEIKAPASVKARTKRKRAA